MHFKEIETKYRAEEIKLSDFNRVARELKPIRELQISSFDYYYTNGTDSFIRYRAGSEPQLTMKTKSKDANNFVRTECNLPLDPSQSADEQKKTVDKFCEMAGFKPNFHIYKTCFIYFWDRHNLVYYVVYDEEMKERDRFIEIEMSEKFDWVKEDHAWAELQGIELSLSTIGLNARRRIRLSLFEMFKK